MLDEIIRRSKKRMQRYLEPVRKIQLRYNWHLPQEEEPVVEKIDGQKMRPGGIIRRMKVNRLQRERKTR